VEPFQELIRRVRSFREHDGSVVKRDRQQGVVGNTGAETKAWLISLHATALFSWSIASEEHIDSQARPTAPYCLSRTRLTIALGGSQEYAIGRSIFESRTCL